MTDQRSPIYKPIYIEALGQTWQFTPAAVRTLTLTGYELHTIAKQLIMYYGSQKGFDTGEYEIDSVGILLKLIVKDDLVVVDDPYA